MNNPEGIEQPLAAFLPLLVRVDPRWPGAWDQLSPYLASALKEGDGERDWSLEDMYEGAVWGKLALWGLVVDGAVFGATLTCITHYPRRAVMEVLAMGADSGKEAAWHACLDQLMEHAKQMNVQAIIGTGRPGWARKLGAIERRVFELPLECD